MPTTPIGADALRVAAQAALTALENLHEIDTETECITIDVRDEIDALRAALASAAQPERVPLTDVQIDKYLPLGVAGYSALIGDDEIRAFARAVEAMHGIKPAKEDKP